MEYEIIIRDTYCKKTKKGSYVSHLLHDDKLHSIVESELECETRVELMVDAIKKCVNKLQKPSDFKIITLMSWGASMITDANGCWLSTENNKRLNANINKDILIDLQNTMKSKGHRIVSFLNSRNRVFEKIIIDADYNSHSYITFKVTKETKRKFTELCYSRGIDEEKVLNKILESFINRNTQ